MMNSYERFARRVIMTVKLKELSDYELWEKLQERERVYRAYTRIKRFWQASPSIVWVGFWLIPFAGFRDLNSICIAACCIGAIYFFCAYKSITIKRKLEEDDKYLEIGIIIEILASHGYDEVFLKRLLKDNYIPKGERK